MFRTLTQITQMIGEPEAGVQADACFSSWTEAVRSFESIDQLKEEFAKVRAQLSRLSLPEPDPQANESGEDALFFKAFFIASLPEPYAQLINPSNELYRRLCDFSLDDCVSNLTQQLEHQIDQTLVETDAFLVKDETGLLDNPNPLKVLASELSVICNDIKKVQKCLRAQGPSDEPKFMELLKKFI